MPRYIRAAIPGATYFFTLTLTNRSSDALVREIGLLRRAYGAVHRRHPFTTVAVCVLPDHLHAIWRLPEGDSDYALRWQQIKTAFSKGCPGSAVLTASQQAKREKGVWQRRYWEHLIRDEEDLERHVNCIHFNPVKHGHAQRVQDWPHGSFHRWVARGDLPASWGLVEAPGEGLFGE